MAFIENNSVQLGDKVRTTIIHESFAGHFEIGTFVTVIGIGDRDYDIQDEDGNRIIEIGWKI